MKGVIDDDHVPLNKFSLVVIGTLVPKFTFLTLSGLEEVLDTVALPDRSIRSGGRTQPVEFTVTLPLHHIVEQVAMEAWYREARDPVTPTYRKPATLILPSLSGSIVRTFSFPDLFVSRRGLPDFDFDNDGEMAASEWTLRASEMFPI